MKLRVSGICALLVVTCGCSAGAEVAGHSSSDDQVILKAQSAEKYSDAQRQFVTCLEKNGLKSERRYINKGDSWRVNHDVVSPSGEVNMSVVADCSHVHLRETELEHAKHMDDVIDPRLLQQASSCLKSEGWSGGVTSLGFTDLVSQVGARESVAGCLTDAMKAVFPTESLKLFAA